jgi:hypothetical protein
MLSTQELASGLWRIISNDSWLNPQYQCGGATLWGIRRFLEAGFWAIIAERKRRKSRTVKTVGFIMSLAGNSYPGVG